MDQSTPVLRLEAPRGAAAMHALERVELQRAVRSRLVHLLAAWSVPVCALAEWPARFSAESHRLVLGFWLLLGATTAVVALMEARARARWLSATGQPRTPGP